MSHQKAPFSFHCTICYEFLNRSDRSPVVLPCGHTYICELCANRLDRCMECRESLFRSEDRLPTPKNHVLLCLMESVEGELGSSPSKGVKNIVVDEGGYQSGDDDELVTVSMKVMGNSSGTYMVREKNGLKLYRFIPKKSWGGNLKNKMLGASEKSAGQRSYKKNIELKQGQIVQVIHFINNIATLTRGLGYIVVEDSSQLVKVAELTDAVGKEQVKLEVLEKTLQSQHQDLEVKLKQVKEKRFSIRQELKRLLKYSKKQDEENQPTQYNDDSYVEDDSSVLSVPLPPTPGEDILGQEVMEGTSFENSNKSPPSSPLNVPARQQARPRNKPQHVRSASADLAAVSQGLNFSSGMSGHRGLSRNAVQGQRRHSVRIHYR